MGLGTERDIQHAKDQSYSLVDMLRRKCLLHVMKYTLRSWKYEFISIFECFSLNKFYMLRDKLLLAKNTKNKQNGPINAYI